MRFVLMCLSFLSLSLFGSVFIAHAADKSYTNSIGMEFVLIPAGSFHDGREPD
jgi:formylglycine-generating enzyme required for sulfatase activity